jgi:hypothetical protein
LLGGEMAESRGGLAGWSCQRFVSMGRALHFSGSRGSVTSDLCGKPQLIADPASRGQSTSFSEVCGSWLTRTRNS